MMQEGDLVGSIEWTKRLMERTAALFDRPDASELPESVLDEIRDLMIGVKQASAHLLEAAGNLMVKLDIVEHDLNSEARIAAMRHALDD